MLIDYHIHLEQDSYLHPLRLDERTVVSYIEQAQARGVTEIGISEHCYRFTAFAPIVQDLGEGTDALPEVTQFLSGCFQDRLESYVTFLLDMKEKGYPVKLGLEVDYIPGREEAIEKALGSYPWDYVLGSIHFLGKWSIDASPTLGWPTRNVEAVYHEYFDVWEQACQTGFFSSMSHPDLVKKFGHRPATPPLHLYQSAATVAAKAGVAIEVSSAGLRKQVGEIYPAMPLLKAFCAANVPITLGSDAHVASDVGLGLDAAVAWAKEAGYTRLSQFSQGKATPITLG